MKEMKPYQLFLSILIVFCGSILLNSCSTSPQSLVTWSLVKLLSNTEDVSMIKETVDVRNCSATERKTTECSAGTINDLSLTLGGSGGLVGKYVGSIDPSIQIELGIGKNSGETLSLDSPQSGYIYVYDVEKKYRVVTGKVLAQSSTGEETESPFTFYASCSISIINVQTLPCTGMPTTSSSGISPTSPGALPTSSELTVSAKEGWQDSYIHIENGSQIRIDVIGGQWTHYKGSAPYNNGVGNQGYICSNSMPASNCVEPLPNAPQGALIGKVGSKIFEIGSGTTIIAEQSGSLSLRINDGDQGLYDNDGSLNIRVSISR